MLLDHLVDLKPEVVNPDEFIPLEDLSPAQTLSAQNKTSNWLKELTSEDDEILDQAKQEKTVAAFNALVANDPSAKKRLLELDIPEEIKSAVGMITAYQWQFVEQAEEIRSMSVAKIVKETDHPDARIRLKALELLGKVTEVALFTDRVQVKSEEVSDEELEKRIKAKISRYMGAVDVVDVEEIDTKQEDSE
jgi:hypothetical protein